MTDQLTKRLQRGTLAITCLATAMLMPDIAVVNTALPYLARDLHAGLTGVQWVVDAYTLALAAVVLSAGSIADRRGRRLVFVAGTGLFTIASLACALAQSASVLDASRAIQGLGSAFMFASSLAILADAFPGQHERAGAMAAYGATIGASFAVGPAVGGALTTWLGWRAVFFVNVPLGVAALLGTFAWLRESRDPQARKLDWPGQITLSVGLFLLVLALLRGNQDGWGSLRTLAEMGSAILLLVAFVAIQSRVRMPMLPLGLFRRRDFTAAQIAAFAISSSFFALYLYMTLYLQDVLHLSALDAGLVYLPGSILLFVVSAASAQLGKRVRPVALVGNGLVLVALGLILMTIIGPHSSWTEILPGDLVVCIGTGLFNPALGVIALGAASKHSSGLLAGVNDAFRQGASQSASRRSGHWFPPARHSATEPPAPTSAHCTPRCSSEPPSRLREPRPRGRRSALAGSSPQKSPPPPSRHQTWPDQTRPSTRRNAMSSCHHLHTLLAEARVTDLRRDALPRQVRPRRRISRSTITQLSLRRADRLLTAAERH